MEHNYWLSRWQKGEIGFDQEQVNKHLINYWSELDVAQGANVFVPLCGKSIDVHWLWHQGFDVMGAELSETAVQQLFAALDLKPKVTQLDSHKCYHAERLTIYVGDIFQLPPEPFSACQGIYDRGALVALNYDLRTRYASLLRSLCPQAKHLLVTVQYAQPEPNSTPQSISAEEVNRLYGAHYAINQLVELQMPEGIKGITPASNAVWLVASN